MLLLPQTELFQKLFLQVVQFQFTLSVITRILLQQQ